MSLKSFAILLLKHWISMLRGKAKHARGKEMLLMTKVLSKNMKISRLHKGYFQKIMKKIGN